MILHGKDVAESIYKELAQKIQALTTPPTLVAVLVGNNPASLRYIEQKKRFSEKVGIRFILKHFSEDISEDELLKTIKDLNHDTTVSWYIVQLPLPAHINAQTIIFSFSPEKDVDGFHPINQGKVLLWDMSGHIPCTPKWILKILEYYHISLAGKKVVVLWRSNIVGKPITALCINAGATVTSCNSLTPDSSIHTKQADIIITAIWKAHFLKAWDVLPHAILIDVGFSLIENHIYGDIDIDDCIKQGNSYTPVPWGVGPMTVAMLLQNTFTAHIHSLWNEKI